MIFDAFLGKIRVGKNPMGVAATVATKGLGPQDPKKSWPTAWTFWVNRYLENVF